MRILVITCLFFIACLFMCCKKHSDKNITSQEQNVQINGRILDSSGKPISNALITLYPSLATQNSDSNGLFSIKNVTGGEYQLGVSSEGYIRYSAVMSFTKDTVLNIILTKSILPFHAGVTFNFWFQPNSASEINFNMYSKQDFINVKKLGCDMVRLPINLNFMVTNTSNYTMDPIFFNYLDQVVNWAEELQIYLILDNHSYYAAGITSSMDTMLTKVWQQMAAHYANRSNYILYETLNEPHDLPDTTWGRMQQDIINAIRSQDKKHTIMIDADNFDSYNNLALLPKYVDGNLIYDFHFYDTMVFTHQGADFINPPLTSLLNVPFPYDPNRMPPFPSNLNGTWFQQQFNDYKNQGTVANLQNLLNIAVAFRDATHANIFCGEFGALNTAPSNDRVFWYQTVRSYLEKNNIPFTIWDYKDVFGVFLKGSAARFPIDLNIPLLQALNFNVPSQ